VILPQVHSTISTACDNMGLLWSWFCRSAKTGLDLSVAVHQQIPRRVGILLESLDAGPSFQAYMLLRKREGKAAAPIREAFFMVNS